MGGAEHREEGALKRSREKGCRKEGTGVSHPLPEASLAITVTSADVCTLSFRL